MPTPPLTGQSGTLRPLLRLVWPVLAEQLLVMLVGFSDTILAGHYLTESHLAAMAVMSYALWLMVELFAVVAIGSLAMTARFVGAGEWIDANRVVNQSFLLGILIALPCTAVGLYGVDTFAALMQLEGEPAELAIRFLRILIPLMPLMMLEVVGIACLRAAGDMITGMIAMIMVNVVNISVSWALVSGAGPFPELGWNGLAIGTACGHAVGGLIPFVVLLVGRAGLRIRRSMQRPDLSLMRRILRIGLPGGIDLISLVLLQLVFLALISGLSTDELAAHGVAIRIEAIAYLPGYAFQVAAATLSGQFLGAKNYRQATKAIVTACAVSSSLLAGLGLVLWFGGRPLVELFVSADQTDVIALAPRLLRIVSVALVPLALLQVLTGALRGAGDTRWPLLFTFVGFVGVRLPLAWLLAYHWQWGVAGAWYAMVADVLFRCTLVSLRFRQGGWRKVEV